MTLNATQNGGTFFENALTTTQNQFTRFANWTFYNSIDMKSYLFGPEISILRKIGKIAIAILSLIPLSLVAALKCGYLSLQEKVSSFYKKAPQSPKSTL